MSFLGGGVVDCGVIGARYLIDTAPIILKAGVWLRGVDVPVSDYWFLSSLPTLLITYGKTDETKHAVLQRQGSRISGFNLEYPDQIGSDMKDPHTGALQTNPYAYGWAITTDNVAYGTSNVDAISAGNIFLKNAYNGIKYFRTGKYDLRDIYGQPIRRGLIS